MDAQKVIFRADASKKTGYGHFIRSLALAGYLKKDYDCHFATYNEDYFCGMPSDYQLDEIIKICNPLAVIGESLQEFNEDFLKEVQHGDIVVLDNYYFDTVYQQSIRDKGCKLVCIDDMHQYHMVCDLLLTGSPLKRENFSLEPYTEFRGGIEWSFLREPFFSPVMTRSVSPQFRKIVVAMGGADSFNLTDKIVEAILSVIPEAHLDVICGDSANVAMQNNPKVRIHHRISAKDIVKLFDDADAGIFSASTICMEAISRELPIIAGYYVDNQMALYNYGVEHKYFSGLGSLMDDVFKIEDRLGYIIGNSIPKPKKIDFLSQKKKTIELFKSL